MLKLRICIFQVNFRYLVGIIEDEFFLPIIIDLKKGRYGKNLGLKGDKKTVKVVENTINTVIAEFIEHSENLEDNDFVTFHRIEN